MKLSSKKSFGLIETLIACAILIIIAGAVLAINVVVNNNLQFTRERAQAYYRASEAIEAVRNIRDTNYIDGHASTDWNSFFCDNTQSKILPIPDLDAKYIIDTDCHVSGYENRFFILPAEELGGYTRELDGIEYLIYIKFERSGINPEITNGSFAENSIRVLVTVKWNSKGRSHKIELREILTNWKQSL